MIIINFIITVFIYIIVLFNEYDVVLCMFGCWTEEIPFGANKLRILS